MDWCGAGFLEGFLSWLPGVFLAAGYIANHTFPQRLSDEEEEEYLRRFSEGDEEARNLLIEHNLRLVAHVLKKFDGTGEDIDDLISIGTIGLIKAINTFDPGRGTRLATYAARCIENEILITGLTRKKMSGGEIKYKASVKLNGRA